MKKLKVGTLENLSSLEKELFDFFKELNLENISKLKISPEIDADFNDTFFIFKTKANEVIQFYYERNQRIININAWNRMSYIGKIAINRDEVDEKREKWLNSIWEQFVDYFNLRIRLMFISVTVPWRWNTVFIY